MWNCCPSCSSFCVPRQALLWARVRAGPTRSSVAVGPQPCPLPAHGGAQQVRGCSFTAADASGAQNRRKEKAARMQDVLRSRLLHRHAPFVRSGVRGDRESWRGRSSAHCRRPAGRWRPQAAALMHLLLPMLLLLQGKVDDKRPCWPCRSARRSSFEWSRSHTRRDLGPRARCGVAERVERPSGLNGPEPGSGHPI